MRLLTPAVVLLVTAPLAAQQPWTTFTSPKKDFMIATPGPMRTVPVPAKTAGAPETVAYQYVDQASTRTFQVVRTTLDRDPNDRADFLLDSTVETLERNVFRVQKKESFTDKDYQREVYFLMNQGMYFRYRYYLKDNYLYCVAVSAGTEKGLDDAVSLRFLDSFKILSKATRPKR